MLKIRIDSPFNLFGYACKFIELISENDTLRQNSSSYKPKKLTYMVSFSK